MPMIPVLHTAKPDDNDGYDGYDDDSLSDSYNVQRWHQWRLIIPGTTQHSYTAFSRHFPFVYHDISTQRCSGHGDFGLVDTGGNNASEANAGYRLMTGFVTITRTG